MKLLSSSRQARRRWGAAISVVALSVTVLAPLSAQAAVPRKWVDEQVTFILNNQLPSGAITNFDTDVMPYFANIAAIGLLDANTAPSRAGALKWMKWYLRHLNVSGPNTPANSVFDYTYDAATNIETPTGDFDSVDSYASTTLNLASKAYSSGDPVLKKFVSRNIAKYEVIANILNYGSPIGVRAANGLTIAKPSYPDEYTMDNAEVYSGLADFARLESSLGRSSQASYYGSWAATTKDAILSKLWNPAHNNWNAAFGENSDISIFYAGATAQLWPILYGVIAPTDTKAISTWKQFSVAYPTWYSGGIPDDYPWVSIARVAQLMGDTAHASAHLTNLRLRYAPGFASPSSCGDATCGQWYDNEAGWFITANTSRPPVTATRPARSCPPAAHHGTCAGRARGPTR